MCNADLSNNFFVEKTVLVPVVHPLTHTYLLAGIMDGFIITIYGSLPFYLMDEVQNEMSEGHAREDFSKLNTVA